jgi:hypothetical protein
VIARPLPPATRAPRGWRGTAAALAAVLVAGALTSCTAAPSGRLATDSDVTLPSGQPSPPLPVESLPAYDPGSRVGGYAEGFPRALLEAPPEATVVASSAVPGDDGLVQVSLNLSFPASAKKVLAQVGRPLEAHGFVKTTPHAMTGLTAQTAWTRRTTGTSGSQVETLLVGVLDDGDRRLVSISGSVRAPKH